jgi:hypothetical protein
MEYYYKNSGQENKNYMQDRNRGFLYKGLSFEILADFQDMYLKAN